MKLHVIFYPNGNTRVFDETLHEVRGLQPPWFALFLAFLETKGIDAPGCRFTIAQNAETRHYAPFKNEAGTWDWRVKEKTMATTFAWLIERNEEHSRLYPIQYVMVFADVFDWTPSADEALRFARKEDAEAVLGLIKDIADMGADDAMAVEHGW